MNYEHEFDDGVTEADLYDLSLMPTSGNSNNNSIMTSAPSPVVMPRMASEERPAVDKDRKLKKQRVSGGGSPFVAWDPERGMLKSPQRAAIDNMAPAYGAAMPWGNKKDKDIDIGAEDTSSSADDDSYGADSWLQSEADDADAPKPINKQREIYNELMRPILALFKPESAKKDYALLRVIDETLKPYRKPDNWKSIRRAIVYFLSLVFYKLAVAAPTENYRRLLEQATPDQLYDDWTQGEEVFLKGRREDTQAWDKFRAGRLGDLRDLFDRMFWSVALKEGRVVVHLDSPRVCKTFPMGAGEAARRFLLLTRFAKFKDVCVCRVRDHHASLKLGKTESDLDRARAWAEHSDKFIAHMLEEYLILDNILFQ